MSFLSKIAAPSLPTCAVGLESDGAVIVQIERVRGGSYALKRAAAITLGSEILRPDFDEPNILDFDSLARELTNLAADAGLERQKKWAATLPAAATASHLLTVENKPASRKELEELLRWKTERAFGVPFEELRVSRDKVTPDAAGHERYLAIGGRETVLEEYETLFAVLGWRVGLVVPRHIGEARWLQTAANADGDALLLSTHETGFTALFMRDGQPLIARAAHCDPEDCDDELYRVLLFYRDRVLGRGGEIAATGETEISTTVPPATSSAPLRKLLVLGAGAAQEHFTQIIGETLGVEVEPLTAAEVGLRLPSADFTFDQLAAPAGIATLAI